MDEAQARRLEGHKKLLAETKKRLNDKQSEVDKDACKARIEHLEAHIKETEEREKEEAKEAKKEAKAK